jgi:hypothetical protein
MKGVSSESLGWSGDFLSVWNRERVPSAGMADGFWSGSGWGLSLITWYQDYSVRGEELVVEFKGEIELGMLNSTHQFR